MTSIGDGAVELDGALSGLVTTSEAIAGGGNTGESIMLNRRLCTSIVAVGIACSIGTAARAAIMWDESINGDLSNDRLNPTVLTIGIGTNTVIATSVQGDREYFTFNLTEGLQLDAIILFSYTSIDPLSFIGVQEGTQFTEPPTMTNVANLLGYSHFGTGNSTVGTDILDDIGVGAGAIGFTPPLLSGDYVWWSQQTGTNAATYQFDFIVTPAGPSLALLGVGGLLGFSRRRRG